MPKDHLTKRPLSQKRVTKLRAEFQQAKPGSSPKQRTRSRTKEGKFIKLAKNRYARASKQISLLTNLTAHAYEMNSEVAWEVLAKLEKEMADLRNLWEGKLASICGSPKCKTKLVRLEGQGRPRKFCESCRPAKQSRDPELDEMLPWLKKLASKIIEL